jgi:uncharacterized protein (TIGR02996 family)
VACPRCNSPDIFSKKFGFGDVTAHEYECKNCGLFEQKASTDPDFQEWRQRWEAQVAGSRDVEAIMAAATARAKAAAQASAGTSQDGAPPTMEPVVRAPDDDRPRRAYATAVERHRPERAEFIRLQLERFHAERASGAYLGEPSPREADIRQRFGKEWAGSIAAYGRPITTDGKYRGYEFERGFVAQIRTDPDIVVDDRTSLLFELAPIEHLDITADGPVRQVLTSPHLARMRSLDLSNLGLDDDDARVLASDGRLARMEWLNLTGNQIGLAGVAALLASPQVRAIPMVLMLGNPSDPAAQYNHDYDGSVMDSWLPAEGKEAEEKYGRINWLHLPAGRRPDRYHARAARYED